MKQARKRTDKLKKNEKFCLIRELKKHKKKENWKSGGNEVRKKKGGKQKK